MLRLLAIAFVYALVLAAHLRKDRRKGSHPQKSHGNRYRTGGVKRILANVKKRRK